MDIKINDLKKHEYNKEVFIDLEGEEFENLVNSISQLGLLTPILVDENNIILCGHQRVRAYKILKIPEIEANIKKGLSESEKKEIIIADNLNRRQLTEFQEIECYKRLKEIEIEKTEQSRKNKVSEYRKTGEVSDKCPTPRTDDKSAEKVSKKTGKKKSGRTYERQIKREEELKSKDKGLFEQFKKGIITLNKAIKILKDREIEQKKREQEKETKKAKKKVEYQLINGDLFDEIKNIKRQFDLIYIDPPYNILDEEWDKFSEKNFKEFTYKWLNIILPKLKEDGRLYVSFSQWGMFNFHEWMKEFCEKFDLIFTNMIIWHYRNNIKPHNKKSYKYSYEPLFYFRKKNAKDLNDLPEFGEERLDVWTIATPQSNYNGDKKEHPAQKPKELLRRIILTGCNNGAWIFDPFAGIGTTGIVAKECGKNFVLIEKNKDYFKILKENLKNG